MYTLLFSVIILVLGITAMAYSTYTLNTLDNTLSGFGRWATPLKWVLLVLGALLFIGAVISIVMYFKTGTAPNPTQVFISSADGTMQAADYTGGQLQSADTGVVGEDAMTDKGFGKIKSVLLNQSDQKTVTQNGIQGVMVGGANALPDNILTKFWLPQFSYGDADGCSRNIKPYGNCQGITRHFRDDQRTIASGCNKILVTAPQSFPFLANYIY